MKSNTSGSDGDRPANSTTLRVLPFGPLTDILGGEAPLETELPLTAAELRERLLAVYPGLRAEQFRIAVDRRLLGEEGVVNEAREIALLPPFAGG